MGFSELKIAEEGFSADEEDMEKTKKTEQILRQGKRVDNYN